MRSTMLRLKFVLFFLTVLIGPLVWGQLPTVAARTWYKIPSRIADVVESSCSPGGTSSTSISTWGGGVYNDSSHEYNIFGGGHGDWSCNGMYALKVDSSTVVWRRIQNHHGTIDNSAAAELTCRYSGVETDIRSRHTYNHVQWMSQQKRFISATCKDPAVSASNSPAIPQRWDRITMAWTQMTDNPIPASGITASAVSAYDRQTGILWFNGQGGSGFLARLRYNDNTWASHGDIFCSNCRPQSHSTCDIDTVGNGTHNLMLCIGGLNAGASRMVGFLLDTSDTQIDTIGQRRITTGPQKCQEALRPGFVYSPTVSVPRRFVAWCGGDSVFAFNPATNVWSALVPALSNTVTPTSPLANGTFGRWRSLEPTYPNMFILVQATTDSTYLYNAADPASRTWGPFGNNHMFLPSFGF